MRIGSKLQYVVPDKCPEDCAYNNQSSISSQCMLCPVLLYFDYEFNGLDTKEYPDNLAEEWELFFKTGREPKLNEE